jgi:molecular chaperone DnaK (HSP70)
MSAFLGIDFGTSTSSMAWVDADGKAETLRNEEGEERTPSVVYYGENEVLVGKYAEDYLEDEAEMARVVTSIKRDIASNRVISLPGRQVRPVEVATEIFKKLKRDAEELHFHQPVNKAVVTVPAAFDTVQRDKIKAAATAAGFAEVALLEEPVAAAIACLQEGLNLGNRVMVYDLGGGTFDLAVLAREDGAFRVAMEPRGIARCGGDDFDRALYDFCETAARENLGAGFGEDGYSLKRLRRFRLLKERLSQTERVSPREYATNNQLFQQPLTRGEFEALIANVIDRTVLKTRELIAAADGEGEQIDNVILIGGSSRIPLIQKQLSETVNIPILRTQHQDVAVALGAAIHAQGLWDASRVRQQALQQYRAALEAAWADKNLSPDEMEYLEKKRRELKLLDDDAQPLEREVFGRTMQELREKTSSASDRETIIQELNTIISRRNVSATGRNSTSDAQQAAHDSGSNRPEHSSTERRIISDLTTMITRGRK